MLLPSEMSARNVLKCKDDRPAGAASPAGGGGAKVRFLEEGQALWNRIVKKAWGFARH